MDERREREALSDSESLGSASWGHRNNLTLKRERHGNHIKVNGGGVV